MYTFNIAIVDKESALGSGKSKMYVSFLDSVSDNFLGISSSKGDYTFSQSSCVHKYTHSIVRSKGYEL